MRIAAWVCAALMLGGCNFVTSPKPLFFAKDATGQPQLKPGIWMDEKAGCTIDPSQPLAKWPDCSDAWVVRPDEILAAKEADKPAKASSAWTHYKIVLARGDPAVLQVEVGNDGDLQLGYVYGGLRPLKLDAQGRVIEYKLWPALCGPPPAEPTDTKGGFVTRHPIEGLKVDEKLQDCVASAQGPVQASVKLSEAWNDKDDNEGRDRARWVREGEE